MGSEPPCCDKRLPQKGSMQEEYSIQYLESIYYVEGKK